MLAIKCDRCGKFGEPYLNETDIIAIQTKVHHIDKGTYNAGAKHTYHICSECVKEFEEFMNVRADKE